MEITDRTDKDIDLEDVIDSYLEQRFDEIRFDMRNVLTQMGITLRHVGDDEEVIDFTEIEDYMKENGNVSE